MKVDGVGKIIEGVNALEAALNSNRVKKVIVLDTKLNKSNKFNFLIEDIKKQNIEIEIVKDNKLWEFHSRHNICLLYTSPSPRDDISSRMPSSA